MAIVKNPGLSIQASGNVCGLNFTTWRGLAILRCAWTGTVPNTPKQLTMQGFMTAVSRAWGGTLTVAERQTYINSARSVVWRGRFGDPYVPTGYQLFMKLNIRRKVMALPIMNIAPWKQPNVYVELIHITMIVATPSIKVRLMKAPGVDIDGYGVEYYRAGPYDSGGRQPIEGEWLFIAREVPAVAYFDLDVIVNKWYHYRGRQINQFGDVGNWFNKGGQLV